VAAEPSQEWLTTVELAEWFQVPVETVRRWRYVGTGPKGMRLGRHVRYRRSDIEAWLHHLSISTDGISAPPVLSYPAPTVTKEKED
jgi:excisionase family DNA binding protein